MNRNKILLTLLGALLGGIAVTTTQAKTLAESVEKAVLRNPEVRARWHELRAADEDINIARSNYLPRLDVQAAAGRAWQDEPDAPSESYSNPSASVELRQILFDGFATRDEVRRASYAKLSRYYDLLAVSDQYAMETVQAYYDVLRFRELVRLAERNHATHLDIFKLIEERTQAGVGRRVDLEQAAGRLALAESNLLTERSNLYDVSARYARLVGEEPGELAAPPELGGSLPTPAEVLGQAVKRNPAFLAAVSNIRSARAGTGVSRSGYWPTLELRASQGFEKNQDGAEGDFRNSRLMLMLNYNLFKGGGDRARERRAVEQLSGAIEMRDKACREIRQTTQIAWNNVQRLGEQLKYLEQHELSTRKARDAYRQQFDIGQRSLLDVLDTENELFDASRALASGRIDRKIAEARVLAQTHQLLAALKLTPLETQVAEQDLAGSEIEDEQVRCSTVLPAAEPAISLAPVPTSPAAPAADASLAEVPAMPGTATRNEIAQQIDNSDKALETVVRTWANAWSAKNVAAYFDHYATDFKPEGGVGQPEWVTQRTTRLTNPNRINVRIDRFQVLKKSTKAAEVRFIQHYESAQYRDEVSKTLILLHDQGRWKIARERINVES
ncbi:TolC family outer membrane protein [Chitiniphilus purpureus]|uniref:TolC family outer membrane protein n=1 Tax=Chitiniphilus purpureus TaxID=2981137 RepID=A0ABY6DIR3_9NEIS|nr:TolC family outer membrane protein [Chitiniphilus sp. CD1]UXY14234.1 TolC family outer membrane protein [Chitiniphilus sp. CD1]